MTKYTIEINRKIILIDINSKYLYYFNQSEYYNIWLQYFEQQA